MNNKYAGVARHAHAIISTRKLSYGMLSVADRKRNLICQVIVLLLKNVSG